MSKPLIEVAFKLLGQGFAPEEVSREVHLVPTRTWRRGDRVQGTDLRRKHDGWMYGLEQRPAYDMDQLLRQLLDALGPSRDRIVELAARLNLERQISFGAYVKDETPAAWFAEDTIRRVADLGAGLDIDLILTE